MKNPSFWFRIFLVFCMFVAGMLMYPYLPDIIPAHWNIEGEPDRWGQKNITLWIIPLVALVITFLFPFFQHIDPKSKNYNQFSGAWNGIQTIIIGFLTYTYVVSLYISLFPEKSSQMQPMMLSALGTLFVFLGNYMGKIRQNYFVGLKTPWTLSDPIVWQKSQRVAGWSFVFGGIIFLIEAWLQWQVKYVFWISIPLIVLIPIVYSYLLSQKMKTKNE